LRLVIALFFALSSATAQADAIDDLLNEGRVSEAWPRARDAAEAEDATLAEKERYVDLLLSVGQAGKAMEWAKGLLRSGRTPDNLYLVGRASIDPSESRDYFEDALQLNSNHAPAMVGMAALMRVQDNQTAALTWYEKAVKLNPNLREAWVGMIQLHLEAKDPQAALDICYRAMVAIPSAPEPWLTASALKPSDANRFLAEAARRAPTDPRVFSAMIRAAIMDRDIDRAGIALDKLKELAPYKPDTRRWEILLVSLRSERIEVEDIARIQAAWNLEETSPEAALIEWTKLIRERPESIIPRLSRARILAVNDPDGAIKDLTEVLIRIPDHPEGLAMMGLAELKRNNPTAAIAPLVGATRARPEDPSLLVALGRAYGRTGQYKESFTVLEHAQVMSPRNPDVVIAWAENLSRQGQKETAYHFLLRAAEKLEDGELLFAAAAAAQDAGLFDEARGIYNHLARQTGSERYRELANAVPQ